VPVNKYVPDKIKKGNKLSSIDQFYTTLSSITPQTTLSWFARVWMEKAKKDFTHKKINVEAYSLDEYTTLELLDECQSVTESAEMIGVHIKNLELALKESHPFAKTVC
jgi:hypothetical protein